MQDERDQISSAERRNPSVRKRKTTFSDQERTAILKLLLTRSVKGISSRRHANEKRNAAVRRRLLTGEELKQWRRRKAENARKRRASLTEEQLAVIRKQNKERAKIRRQKIRQQKFANSGEIYAHQGARISRFQQGDTSRGKKGSQKIENNNFELSDPWAIEYRLSSDKYVYDQSECSSRNIQTYEKLCPHKIQSLDDRTERMERNKKEITASLSKLSRIQMTNDQRNISSIAEPKCTNNLSACELGTFENNDSELPSNICQKIFVANDINEYVPSTRESKIQNFKCQFSSDLHPLNEIRKDINTILYDSSKLNEVLEDSKHMSSDFQFCKSTNENSKNVLQNSFFTSKLNPKDEFEKSKSVKFLTKLNPSAIQEPNFKSKLISNNDYINDKFIPLNYSTSTDKFRQNQSIVYGHNFSLDIYQQNQVECHNRTSLMDYLQLHRQSLHKDDFLSSGFKGDKEVKLKFEANSNKLKETESVINKYDNSSQFFQRNMRTNNNLRLPTNVSNLIHCRGNRRSERSDTQFINLQKINKQFSICSSETTAKSLPTATFSEQNRQTRDSKQKSIDVEQSKKNYDKLMDSFTSVKSKARVTDSLPICPEKSKFSVATYIQQSTQRPLLINDVPCTILKSNEQYKCTSTVSSIALRQNQQIYLNHSTISGDNQENIHIPETAKLYKSESEISILERSTNNVKQNHLYVFSTEMPRDNALENQLNHILLHEDKENRDKKFSFEEETTEDFSKYSPLQMSNTEKTILRSQNGQQNLYIFQDMPDDLNKSETKNSELSDLQTNHKDNIQKSDRISTSQLDEEKKEQEVAESKISSNGLTERIEKINSSDISLEDEYKQNLTKYILPHTPTSEFQVNQQKSNASTVSRNGIQESNANDKIPKIVFSELMHKAPTFVRPKLSPIKLIKTQPKTVCFKLSKADHNKNKLATSNASIYCPQNKTGTYNYLKPFYLQDSIVPRLDPQTSKSRTLNYNTIFGYFRQYQEKQFESVTSTVDIHPIYSTVPTFQNPSHNQATKTISKLFRDKHQEHKSHNLDLQTGWFQERNAATELPLNDQQIKPTMNSSTIQMKDVNILSNFQTDPLLIPDISNTNFDIEFTNNSEYKLSNVSDEGNEIYQFFRKSKETRQQNASSNTHNLNDTVVSKKSRNIDAEVSFEPEKIRETSAKRPLQEIVAVKSENNVIYICEPCELIIENEEMYAAHRAEVHSTKCDEVKHSLKLEIELKRKNEVYVCKICSSVFKSQRAVQARKALAKHMKSVHPNVQTDKKSRVKRFACGACGRCFVFGHLLQDHVNTHTGATPYSCSECGNQFSMRSELMSHVKLHRQ